MDNIGFYVWGTVDAQYMVVTIMVYILFGKVLSYRYLRKSSSRSSEEIFQCKEMKAHQTDQGHRLHEKQYPWNRVASYWCCVLIMGWEVDVTRILKEATL